MITKQKYFIDNLINENSNKLTLFDKLRIKIKNDTGEDIENLKRRYVGIHMKRSGAFVWTSNLVGSHVEVGSSIPVSVLLKCKKLKIVDGWSFAQWEVVCDE
jgi:hypothetical protein